MRTGDRLRLIVNGGDGPDLDARLKTFEAICRKRRGLRLERRGTDVLASIDPVQIEQVGPLVEAAAIANDLRVMIADLDAAVRSAGLEAGPSGIWAAIGNAADELEVTRARGEQGEGDLFRYVRVEDIDGLRTALDDRPPLVEPTGSGPMDFGPTKYDDVDYHEGAAAAAGQPREHAFTHIGLYLAWLIRHDLHDHRAFPREHTAAVKRGEMTGSDLADDTDWKLLSDLMTDDGAAFSDARYETYLAEYGALLETEPDYGVPGDEASYARVEPLIGRLYADWVAEGRPKAEPKPSSPMDAQVEEMIEAVDVSWVKLTADASGPIEMHFAPDGTYEVRRPERPHVAADLEALVPLDLTNPPIEMSSRTATHWGSSLLNRALKQLHVRPRDAVVATGFGGNGEQALFVMLYQVPGASAEDLGEAFATAIHRPRRAPWQLRRVGATEVWWAEGWDADLWFAVAYWTRDGLVFHLNGTPDDMEMAIRRLG